MMAADASSEGLEVWGMLRSSNQSTGEFSWWHHNSVCWNRQRREGHHGVWQDSENFAQELIAMTIGNQAPVEFGSSSAEPIEAAKLLKSSTPS